MTGDDPATNRQKQWISDLGATAIPEDLSRAEASAWIDELKEYDAVSRRGTIPEARIRTDLFQRPPSLGPAPAPTVTHAVSTPVPGSSVQTTSTVDGKTVSMMTPVTAEGAGVMPPAFRTAAEMAERQRVVPAPTSDQVRLLKAAGRFPGDATKDEIEYGFAVARALGLNPLRKQIRFIRFAKGEPIEPFIAIDGLQAIAARTGQFAGVDAPVFERDVKEPDHPVSAMVTVFRLISGQRCGFTGIVQWSEFAKKDREGKLVRAWTQMPYFMLGKVARAAAIRMGFPEETGGVYVEEEAPGGD